MDEGSIPSSSTKGIETALRFSAVSVLQNFFIVHTTSENTCFHTHMPTYDPPFPAVQTDSSRRTDCLHVEARPETLQSTTPLFNYRCDDPTGDLDKTDRPRSERCEFFFPTLSCVFDILPETEILRHYTLPKQTQKRLPGSSFFPIFCYFQGINHGGAAQSDSHGKRSMLAFIAE